MNKKAELNVGTEVLLRAIPKDVLVNLLEKVNHVLMEKHDVVSEDVPVDIFSSGLSPAEALVKYLKENREMSYHEIGDALARDERGIWGSYNRAKEKMGQMMAGSSEYTVPIKIFRNRKLSIMEAVIKELHKQGMDLKKIAKLLGKSYNTVYTTYTRSNKKEKL